jgi:hypothetical protein
MKNIQGGGKSIHVVFKNLSKSLLCVKGGAGHRVGRVLSFFSSRRNWDFPNPSPEGECPSSPLPPVLGRGAHSLAREGLGEYSDEGTYTVVLFISTYLVGRGDGVTQPPLTNNLFPR